MNQDLEKSNFDDTEAGRIQKKLYYSFLHNYKMVDQKRGFMIYPDQLFKAQGIPTPRQYIAWKKTIGMIGEKQFREQKLKTVSVHRGQVLFCDEFPFGENDVLDITIACGFFWEFHKECRRKMMTILAEGIKRKNWKLTIYTQDKNLESEFNNDYKVHPDIYVVNYRIDLHYTIARRIVGNEVDPEKSCIFLELPHSELFLFRLDICFSFQEVEEKLDCHSIDKFLHFLNQQRKLNLLKSIASKFNLAIKGV